MESNERPHLSASQIRRLNECPASWYMSRHPDLFKPRGNMRGRDRGQAVHMAIEDAIVGTDRSGPIAKLLAERPWEPSPSGLTKEEEYTLAIDAFNALAPSLALGDPSAEKRVTGEIAGVKVRGVVDCIAHDGDLRVVYDWKTGRPRPEDRMQMCMYARILGTDNTSYRLVYLRDGTVEEIDYVGDDVVDHYVRSAAERIDACAAEGLFPAVVGPACDHCDYRHCCPGWEAVE